MSSDTVKILLVDVCDSDRQTYRRYLSNNAYTVLEAHSSDVLEICRTQSFDVILFNLLQPADLTLLEELRSLPSTIIVITEQRNESIVENYLIRNQITFETLINTVRSAIELSQLKRQLAQTQQVLSENQRFTQRVTEAIPGILYIYDLVEQCNVYVNRQITQLLGFTAEQLQEMDGDILSKLIHPDDFDRASLHLTQFQTAQDDQVFEFEYRMRSAAGDWCWLHSQEVVFRRSSNGIPDQILGIAQQITQRKSAEIALQRSEAKFRRLFDSNVTGIFFADFSGQIDEANDAFLDMIGYTRSDLEAGQLNWQTLTPPGYEAAALEIEAQLRATGVAPPAEKEYFRKDGSRVPLLIGTATLEGYDREGYSICFVLDLSDRKRAAQEREQLLAEAEVARAEAETANRSKDEFLAVVSHELRSPLNSILGWAKLLQTRTYDSDTIHRALATIERNARSQSQLIEDLLDVSRMIRGSLRITLVPVNLASIVETAITNIQLAADAKEINLRSQLERSIGLVSGDPQRLQQILTNLLTNAVKFTPTGGSVQVILQTSEDNESAEMIVRDTGKGIDAEFLPLIFDRFAQAENDSSRTKDGLGLGLAIVRHLVELHQGTVRAESPGSNQGATFIVRLPLI